MGATPPVFWIDAEARGVSLARLLEQLEGSDAYSGALNGDLEWKGSVASPRELAGSLAGELVLAASDGAISTDHASLLTRDWLGEGWNLLVTSFGAYLAVQGVRSVPSPRNPSPLSTAATIRVTGPILSPRVTSEKSSFAISTSKALLEAVPWLSRSRKTLRELVGAGEQFGRCRELLQQ